MPIQGMSDKETRSEAQISYPLFGKVHKGAEKPQRGPGRNLDHFRIEWFDISAQTAFEVIYGDTPRSIPIVTLSKEVDAVFDSWYRKYNSNQTLERKCDGCTIVKALNRDLVGQDCFCDPEQRTKDNSKTCNPQGYLYFTIAEICQRLGYIGQFILGTGSPIEISEISATLQTVYNVTGTLEYQRFMLQRSERKFDIEINGKPSQVNQWMVEIVPPIDNILKIGNSAQAQLPVAETPQLESAHEDDNDNHQDDFVDHRAPVISQDALSKIDKFVSVATGFTLENLLNTLGEISSDTVPYADIDQITYEQISFHLLEQMARCAVPFKVNSMGYDKGKKRHYIPFMAENILMFTRDKFREPLKQSGMNDDAIKAFVNHFDKKDINFMNDLEIPLEELPLIYVSQVIDNETGEHKYFEVEHVRIADSMVNQETGSLDDIPF